MKVSRLLLFTEAFMAFVLFAYLSSFPIFPEIPSVDFQQHIALSRNLAHGIFPTLGQAVLYYGIEFYLAVPQVLFPNANPFMVTRLAMALLVFVSPLIVYLCCKEIFEDDFKAKMCALVYAVSGFVWFEMVFVSGLYANFYGVLSSLFLVAAAFRFQRTHEQYEDLAVIPLTKDAFVFYLAILNALFSHYSTLLLFPPLIAYMAIKRDQAGVSALGLPLLGGALAFPSLVKGIAGFLAPTSNVVPQPTFLSSLMPLPSLSFMAEELTDPEFAFVMLSVFAFGWLAYKKRDPRMLFVLSWFILVVVASPPNSSAWRSAFVALVPATLMLGFTLSKLAKFPFYPNGKNILLIVLIVSPVFYPSWSYFALSHSVQSDSQQGVYDAVRWMGTNLAINPVCTSSAQEAHCPHVVSVNDWRLTYSPLFDGPMVLYALDYGVVWSDPLQVQLFAATHNSTYIAVVKDGTIGLPACNPRFALGLTMSANMTEVRPNETLALSLSGFKGLNATVSLFDNGVRAARVTLVKGNATVDAVWNKPGLHSLVMALGTTATLPLNVTVGGSGGGGQSTVKVPPGFCQPWDAYNPASMAGWILVYQSADVKIYKVNV